MSIPDEWKFPGRDYPAANDHINSLLNFGYYLQNRRSGRPTGTRARASMRAGREGGRGREELSAQERGRIMYAGSPGEIVQGMITGWRWARRSDGVMCQSPD